MDLIAFAVDIVWLAGALVVGLVLGLSLLAATVGRFVPGFDLLIGLVIRGVFGLAGWLLRLAVRFVRGAVIDHPLLTAMVVAAAREKRWVVIAVPGLWWFPWALNTALLSLAGMGVIKALSGDDPSNTRANARRLHRLSVREIGRIAAVGEATREGIGNVAQRVRRRSLPPPPASGEARRSRFAELVDRHRRRHRHDAGADPYASDAEKVDAGALTPDQAAGRDAVVSDPYASPAERSGALTDPAVGPDPATPIPVGPAPARAPAPVNFGATP